VALPGQRAGIAADLGAAGAVAGRQVQAAGDAQQFQTGLVL
jgi:hypothetical protein